MPSQRAGQREGGPGLAPELWRCGTAGIVCCEMSSASRGLGRPLSLSANPLPMPAAAPAAARHLSCRGWEQAIHCCPTKDAARPWCCYRGDGGVGGGACALPALSPQPPVTSRAAACCQPVAGQPRAGGRLTWVEPSVPGRRRSLTGSFRPSRSACSSRRCRGPSGRAGRATPAWSKPPDGQAVVLVYQRQPAD